MTKLLLYADDPGAVNFLAPLRECLVNHGYYIRFLVDKSISDYSKERGILVEARKEDETANTLLGNCNGLVVGTSELPNAFGHILVAEARVLGLPSVGVVDMEVNSENRFRGGSKNPLRYSPDWLIVADEESRIAFVGLGFDQKRVFVSGHPHLDVVRAKRRVLEQQDQDLLRKKSFPTAPGDRPIWLFLAEGVDQLRPEESFRSEDYTLHGRGDSDFRACVVIQEILDIRKTIRPLPWVVLRLHPRNKVSQFDQVKKEVDQVCKDGDVLPLLWSADLVLGMTSMALFETYILGRPHLSILPREVERKWLFSLKQGLTPCVTNSRDLEKRLKGNLKISRSKKVNIPAVSLEKIVDQFNTIFCFNSST